MKNGSKIFIICLTCSILLACSVKKTNNYIPLEEFSINNKPLDSICRSTISRIKLDTCESVLVLELICMDEAKYYYLSSQDKGLLMDCYICWNNRRIVGYTWFDKYLAIILSNVDNHYDFLDMFADDLDLQKGVAKFSFMYVPESRYRWEDIDGKELDWKDKGQLYEPVFLVCKEDSSGVHMITWTNDPQIKEATR